MLKQLFLIDGNESEKDPVMINKLTLHHNNDK